MTDTLGVSTARSETTDPRRFWLGLVAVVALLATGALSIHRYSRGHIVGQLAIAGRGLFVSHTPDGSWWRLRLRSRRCGFFALPGDPGDEPPATGVREPRRPLPPGPRASSIELDWPG
jgi:hypothetical protein